ncbi:hypothetical protein [Frankia canadensis]|uniref:hypothetical protein n=1 Tax=Frankia canadensis TaxID=1836972 RepID=UPI001402C9DF|nr:hypothetical protein [Frankia canadensis]
MSARWLRGEVLDTGRYLDTVAPLADNPLIQDAESSTVAPWSLPASRESTTSWNI